MYWPDNQKELSQSIQTWIQQWNEIPTEKDGNLKKQWLWTPGKWIEYNEQNDGLQLGQVPFPVLNSHLDKPEWERWFHEAKTNWGEPNQLRIVSYQKSGGELVILPNGKQFVRKIEMKWGGRLQDAGLFYNYIWELKNERFPMVQFLDQRIDMMDFIWDKQGVQYHLRECLEEKGCHWYDCQVHIPDDTTLSQNWRQWVQWGNRGRDMIRPFWGDYELKTYHGSPFMSYHLN
jgi:hypothetical protein